MFVDEMNVFDVLEERWDGSMVIHVCMYIYINYYINYASMYMFIYAVLYMILNCMEFRSKSWYKTVL